MQRLAKHVMKVHLNALQTEDTVEGELTLTTLKKFIAYARSLVSPLLSVKKLCCFVPGICECVDTVFLVCPCQRSHLLLKSCAILYQESVNV